MAKLNTSEKSALFGLIGALVFLLGFATPIPQYMFYGIVPVYALLGTVFFVMSFLVHLHARMSKIKRRII